MQQPVNNVNWKVKLNMIFRLLFQKSYSIHFECEIDKTIKYDYDYDTANYVIKIPFKIWGKNAN